MGKEAATRIYCIFEWYSTVKAKKRLVLTSGEGPCCAPCLLLTRSCCNCGSNILDAANAKARSKQDEKAVKDKIARDVGYERINMEVTNALRRASCTSLLKGVCSLLGSLVGICMLAFFCWPVSIN